MPMLGIANQQGYNLGTTILADIYKSPVTEHVRNFRGVIHCFWRCYCFTEINEAGNAL
jgi:hypothetical protein